MSSLSLRLLMLAATLLIAPASVAFAFDPLQECSRLTDWTPANVTGFVQTRKAGARLRSFLDSAKLKRILDSKAGKAYQQSDDYQEMMENLSGMEKATNRKPLDLFDDLLGTDALLASRLTFTGGNEWLLLTRGKNKSALEAGRKALDTAAEANFGFPIQTETTEHEGHTIEKFGDTQFAFLDDILAVSNSKKMLEDVIDLASGRTEKSVSRSPVYSRAPADDEFLARATIKPGFIPGIGAGLAAKLDDPVTSLLLSGLMGALRDCELVTLSLDGSWSGIDLGLVLHPDDRGIAGKYSPFFPKTAPGKYESSIRMRKMLSIATLSRDLGQWWESSEQFLSAEAKSTLARVSAAVSLFMGGLDFQEEILPKFGKTGSLVLGNQEPVEGNPTPSPAIPGGALVLDLEDSSKDGKTFIVGFKSVVGIFNLARMQQEPKAPRLLIKSEKVAGVDCYRVDLGLPAKPENPGIEYNFSPTLAISGNRIIIGSTFSLVSLLVEESEKSKGPGATGVERYARDLLFIDGQATRSALRANLDFLSAQQATEKSIGLAEAKAELETIDELLSYIRGFEFQGYRRGDAVHMKFNLGLITDTTIVNPAE